MISFGIFGTIMKKTDGNWMKTLLTRVDPEPKVINAAYLYNQQVNNKDLDSWYWSNNLNCQNIEFDATKLSGQWNDWFNNGKSRLGDLVTITEHQIR